jgi:hypothetical protein
MAADMFVKEQREQLVAAVSRTWQHCNKVLTLWCHRWLASLGLSVVLSICRPSKHLAENYTSYVSKPLPQLPASLHVNTLLTDNS